MNFKYLILTLALIPSIAYTMDEAPKKRSKQKIEQKPLVVQTPKSITENYQKKTKLKKKMVALKNHEPFATHIASMLTPITFHKKTQSIYGWLKNHQNNHFGDTPIVVMQRRIGFNAPCTFTQIGFVRAVENPGTIAQNMGDQNIIYISNTSKKYFSDKEKPISYGTLLVWKELTAEDRNCKGQICINKTRVRANVRYAVAHFLAHLTIQPQEKPKEKGMQVTKESESDDLSGSEKFRNMSNMSEID